MLVRTLDDGTAIRRITDGDASMWEAEFVGAYQTVFEGAPYGERWKPEEAAGIWRQLTTTPGHITLLATDARDRLLGFGVAIPLARRPDITRALAGLVPSRHTFYLAELGVLPEGRGRGIGRTLVRERVRLIDDTRFQGVVLRVPASRSDSFEMYQAMAFEDTGVSMEVSARRVDGGVRTDRRTFLHCVLSQVDWSANTLTD